MENLHGEADAVVAEGGNTVSPPSYVGGHSQCQHPSNDRHLSRFLAPPHREGDEIIPSAIADFSPPFEVLARISQVVMLDEEGTTSPPHARAEFIVPITEIFPESTSTRDEELAENHLPKEFESPNNQNQPELTSLAMDVIDHDPNILTKDEQNTTRLHYYLDPKDVKFWLRLYASFCVPIALMFSQGKQSPLAGCFLKISVVLYVMALIIHIILSCIYERLKNPNSSYQNLPPYGYKILKYVCYILCIFALFLLLPVFLISNIEPSTITLPSPRPHLHHN